MAAGRSASGRIGSPEWRPMQQPKLQSPETDVIEVSSFQKLTIVVQARVRPLTLRWYYPEFRWVNATRETPEVVTSGTGGGYYSRARGRGKEGSRELWKLRKTGDESFRNRKTSKAT